MDISIRIDAADAKSYISLSQSVGGYIGLHIQHAQTKRILEISLEDLTKAVRLLNEAAHS